MIPASIRTNNPGAQWFGPVASEYGATGGEDLSDGNNAAVFPDPVSGAAAQFALLKRKYAGLPLSKAISKWSGGNSSPEYVNFLTNNTGLSSDTVLTPELLSSPQGLALAKAQAHWEAGRPYPMSDQDWQKAQALAFNGATDAPILKAMQPQQPSQGKTPMPQQQPPSLSAKFLAGGPGALFGAPNGVFPGSDGTEGTGYDLGRGLELAGAGLVTAGGGNGAAIMNAANMPLFRQHFSVTRDAYGNLVVVNNKTGQVVGTPGAGGGGLTQGGYAPNSPIAVMTRTKEAQESSQKKLDALQEAATNSAMLRDKANEALTLLSDPNYQQGALGKAESAIASTGLYTPEGAVPTGKFNKIASQLQGLYLSGQKGVRFAGPEIKFSEMANADSSKPKEVNQQILRDYIKQAELQMAAARLANLHMKQFGMLGPQFNDALTGLYGPGASTAPLDGAPAAAGNRPPLSSFNK